MSNITGNTWCFFKFLFLIPRKFENKNKRFSRTHTKKNLKNFTLTVQKQLNKLNTIKINKLSTHVHSLINRFCIYFIIKKKKNLHSFSRGVLIRLPLRERLTDISYEHFLLCCLKKK